MAARVLRKIDFDNIKSMQKRGWKRVTIEIHSDWSSRTIGRALKSPNWQAYRRLIVKETMKSLKDEDFILRNDAGQYHNFLPKKPKHTRVKIRARRKGKSFFGRVVDFLAGTR